MKVFVLLSGGKDSLLAAFLAQTRLQHELVAALNLYPLLPSNESHHGIDEDLDSYTFQTVGFDAITAIGDCLELPVRRARIRKDQSLETNLDYALRPNPDDEVETLFQLVQQSLVEFPDVKGVVSGAILSHYQRLRVESICHRLGLTSIAPLWQFPSRTILDLLHHFAFDARWIKVSSMGLDGRSDLLESITKHKDRLLELEAKWSVNAAGEGGEYESLVLDCPLFRTKKLCVAAYDYTDDSIICGEEGHCVLRVGENVKVVEKSQAEQARSIEALQLASSSASAGGGIGSLVTELERMRYQPTAGQIQRTAAMLMTRMRAIGDPTERNKNWEIRLPKDGNPFAGRRPSSSSSSAAAPLITWRVELPLQRQTQPNNNSAEECSSSSSTLPQPSSDGTTIESLTDHARRIFAAIRDRAQEESLEVVFLLLFSPSMALFAPFNKIYEQFFEIVRPPGRAFVEYAPFEGLRVDVVAVPLNRVVGKRDVLHVQSMSFWASASIGPYAQANRITYSLPSPVAAVNRQQKGAADDDEEDDEPTVMKHLFVSGRIGMVPKTLNLSTIQDLRGTHTASLEAVNNLAAALKVSTDFIAEFFFTMANSVVGVEHFYKQPMLHPSTAAATTTTSTEGEEGRLAGTETEDQREPNIVVMSLPSPFSRITRALFFLVDPTKAAALPLLWEWYFASIGAVDVKPLHPSSSSFSSSHDPNVHDDENTKEEKKKADVCQTVILHVTKMPKGAQVEVILECEEIDVA